MVHVSVLFTWAVKHIIGIKIITILRYKKGTKLILPGKFVVSHGQFW